MEPKLYSPARTSRLAVRRSVSLAQKRRGAFGMQRIFEGLTVLDCASFIAAPAAATILADFGAEVIKIEPPAGDPFRQLPQLPGNPKSEHNWAWMLESRNKQGLALDLSKADGDGAARRRLHHQFSAGRAPAPRHRLQESGAAQRAARLRILHRLRRERPGGEQARLRQQCLVGALGHDGPRAAGPRRSAGAIAAGMGDHPSALALFGAIVSALYRRERTGKGAHVGTSLMANGVWSNGLMVQARLCGATIPTRPPREQTFNAMTNHYRCRDGRWLILSLLKEDREWPVLLECLEREDLAADPRFATTPDRHARARTLSAIFD